MIKFCNSWVYQLNWQSTRCFTNVLFKATNSILQKKSLIYPKSCKIKIKENMILQKKYQAYFYVRL